MMLRSILVVAAFLVWALSAQATVLVNSAAFTYSQTFDTLTLAGTSNASANGSTLSGWRLFAKDSKAITSDGTAARSGGGFFAFDAGSDRALSGTVFGSPASGAVAGWVALALALTNSSGGALDSLTLRFDAEQWRNGGATSPNAASHRPCSWSKALVPASLR